MSETWYRYLCTRCNLGFKSKESGTEAKCIKCGSWEHVTQLDEEATDTFIGKTIKAIYEDEFSGEYVGRYIVFEDGTVMHVFKEYSDKVSFRVNEKTKEN